MLTNDRWHSADDEIIISWIRTGVVGPATLIQHATWSAPQPLSSVRGFTHYLQRRRTRPGIGVMILVGCGTLFGAGVLVAAVRRTSHDSGPSSDRPSALTKAPASPPPPPSLPRGATITAITSDSAARPNKIAPTKLPIQMNWSEAEAFVRGLGYPHVRVERDNLWVRGDDQRCDGDEECRTRRPSIIFEFATVNVDQPTLCVSLLGPGPLDWRRFIRDYAGADPSKLPNPSMLWKMYVLKSPIGEIKIITGAEGGDVFMGTGCEK